MLQNADEKQYRILRRSFGTLNVVFEINSHQYISWQELQQNFNRMQLISKKFSVPSKEIITFTRITCKHLFLLRNLGRDFSIVVEREHKVFCILCEQFIMCAHRLRKMEIKAFQKDLSLMQRTEILLEEFNGKE